MSILIVNGKHLDPKTPAISAFDTSYLFGEGLFETMRSYNGVIPFLKDHLARLSRGAKFLRIPMPSTAKLARELALLPTREKMPNAIIKLVLSKIAGNMRGTVKTEETSLSISLEPFVPFPPKLYREGVSAIIVRSVANDPPPLSLHKTTNFLSKILARREVEDKKAFEGVLLNPAGFVSEGSRSNLFWIKDKIVYTPSLTTGCLPGVTRAAILKALKRDGVPVREVAIGPEALFSADEILIASSIAEILPVVSLDQKPIGRGCPGAFFKKMKQLYSASVRLEIV